MMNKYLLILTVGHVLGDFYLQNEKIAAYKDERYKGVLFHSVEYSIACILSVLPVFSTDMLLSALYSAFAHFVIDSVKYILILKRRLKKGFTVFALDQFAHLASILGLVYIMIVRNFEIGNMWIAKSIRIVSGYEGETISRWMLAILLLHIPANIFIHNFLEEYKPNGNEMIIRADYKAGRRIGTIERLIMLIFLSKDQFAALGFILTAKSVARYDRIAKDEKFAEYYLLGTLMSTLWVIICRMLILT